jgi:predicted metal-dependent phosphoesterase TrpH
LIAIETYNATTIDRMSNHYAQILADHLNIAHLGNSDAHIVEAIGLGVTEFPGKTAFDLLDAIRDGTTTIHKKQEWTPVRILGSWAANYIGSTLNRWSLATR